MSGADARPGRLALIACPAVLGELAEGAAEGAETRELEAQLHILPDKLKQALRAAVAEADEPGVTIVLGYGLCSNAVLGLKTEHATLVVPRVDDCIAMLLGSNEAFSMEAEKERGSYYLAKAYLDECANLVTEHEAMVEKYGPERAEKMMRLLLKHYKRVVLVDTGRYELEPLRERVREVAELYDLAVDEVSGTTRIVDGLVADEWGDDFVVAPPGHELTLRDFRPELFTGHAASPAEAATPKSKSPGVNILCIAGFLGSGKTTVLLEVARALAEQGTRLAIIENEIGEVGVDGGYVREHGLPVQELFGGCICCTLQAGLVQTLLQVEEQYHPDWIIVEPTGLAAPGDMLRPIRDNVPDLGEVRVLTLVDAARWEMLLEVVEPLVTSQLESADVVAVNKIDDVDEATLAEVLISVRGLAGDAEILPVSAASGAGMERLLEAVR